MDAFERRMMGETFVAGEPPPPTRTPEEAAAHIKRLTDNMRARMERERAPGPRLPDPPEVEAKRALLRKQAAEYMAKQAEKAAEEGRA